MEILVKGISSDFNEMEDLFVDSKNTFDRLDHLHSLHTTVRHKQVRFLLFTRGVTNLLIFVLMLYMEKSFFLPAF